jgi:hypothetical protein
VVTHLELGDGRADCLDLPRQLRAGDLPLGPQQAGDKAADEVLGAALRRIGPVDRRGVDLDEDFVVLGDRPLDLFQPQNLRRPVPVVDDRPHAVQVVPSRHRHKTSYEPATPLLDRTIHARNAGFE